MAPDGQRPTHPRVRVWRLALGIGSLFLGVHLVLPQLAGLEQTAQRLATTTWWLLAGTLTLEALSYAAYGELTRTVLRAGGSAVTRGLTQRVSLVGSSLGKTLPGGSPAATAVMVATLTAHGTPPGAATMGLTASGALSAVTLAVLLVPASLLALAGGEGGSLALGAAGVAVAVLALVALVPVALRDPDRAAGWARGAARSLARGPLRRWVAPDRIGAEVGTALRSLRQLLADRAAMRRATAWASANWLLDLAVLVLLGWRFGAGGALVAAPLVYVVGQLTAALPLTPGGVGVVESVMIGAMTATGSPAAVATATVLGWRLVSHWLPIAAGLAVLPSVLGGRSRASRRAARRG